MLARGIRGPERPRVRPTARRLAAVAATSLVAAGTVAVQAAPAGASTCGATTNDWTGAVSTSWDAAGNWSAGRIPTATDDVCIDAPGTTVAIGGNDTAASLVARTPVRITGTLTLAAADRPSSVATATLTGTLTGPGSVTVTESMAWPSGTMAGSGTLVVAPGATLTVGGQSNSLNLRARTLRNEGMLDWVNGTFVMYDSAVLANAGTMLIESGYVMYPSTGSPMLVNTGVIRTTSAVPEAPLTVPVRNDGQIVAAPSSWVKLTGGGGGMTSSGSFTGVRFAAGTYALGTGAALDRVDVAGGRLNYTGDGTWSGAVSLTQGLLDVGGTVTSTGTITMTGNSQLHVPGTLVVAGTLSWGGTSVNTWTPGGDSGGMSIAPGGRVDVVQDSSSPYTAELDGLLANYGTMVLGADLEILPGAALRNASTVELRGDVSTLSSYTWDPPGLLVNTGLLVKSAGDGVSSLSATDNSGEIRVDSGTVELSTLTGYAADRRELNQGSYTLAGRLMVPGMGIDTLSTKVTLAGPAAALVDDTGADSLGALTRVTRGGSLDLRGGATVSSGAAVSSAGTLAVADGSRLTAPSLTLTGGRLTGAGTVAADVHNQAGEVSPGSGPAAATLAVAGGYDQAATGRLTLDEGADAGDALAVTGTATLGGTLALRTDAAGPPAVGAARSLLRASGFGGTFGQVTGADLGGGAGYWWLGRTDGELAATVRAATDRPVGTVSVNGGAAYSRSTGVTLAIGIPTGMSTTGMRLANDAAPAGGWQAVSSSLAWTLPTKNGAHTVQVQFRDAEGNTSTVAVATITLDTLAPTATVAKPATPTSAAVVTFSESVGGVTADDVAIRDAAGGTVPATQTCADGSGTAVSCTATTVRTVRVLPTAALARGVAYTVVVNPATSSGRVVDRAGNPAAATSAAFTL